MPGYGLTIQRSNISGYFRSGANFTKIGAGASVRVRLLAKTKDDFYSFWDHFVDGVSKICTETEDCRYCEAEVYRRPRTAVNVFNHETNRLEILLLPGRNDQDFLDLEKEDGSFRKRIIRIKRSAEQTPRGLRTVYRITPLDTSRLLDTEKEAIKNKYILHEIFIETEDTPRPQRKQLPKEKVKEDATDKFKLLLEEDDDETPF